MPKKINITFPESNTEVLALSDKGISKKKLQPKIEVEGFSESTTAMIRGSLQLLCIFIEAKKRKGGDNE